MQGKPLLGLAALQILYVMIDLPGNTWSAQIDGIPIFSKAQFTATGKARSLVTAADTGNNWLLVADWLVAAAPTEPFEILSIARPSFGGTTLTWPGHAAFDYQVFYSADLVKWNNDLPISTFLNVAADGVLSFTDPTAPAPAIRFYQRPEKSESLKNH